MKKGMVMPHSLPKRGYICHSIKEQRSIKVLWSKATVLPLMTEAKGLAVIMMHNLQ